MKTPFQQIRQECEQILPEQYVSYLPNKWEKIGDILLLKLSSELTKYQSEIGKIYAEALHCRSVLKEIGQIDGVYRVPNVEHIWGDQETETIHYENGIRFRLDPSKVMFSSGNIGEKKRMSTISNNTETVVDMFAGIGYFSIPLAVYSKPKKLYSCEINPIAFEFLNKNIVLNDVTEIIEPIFGDNRKVAPQKLADRVLMGYFGGTDSYLHTAVSCLKEEGGIIHYHDIFPEKNVPDKVMKQVEKIIHSEAKNVTLQQYKKVKSFAPGTGHYVFDLLIEP
ncbi:MAG: class I SAM-dependent methyltransferase family protein [Candidatus Thermoplasmatota archaeon]|nr:class I SAM-dependent methyltransferase family protein [Candidatus Thermoplasmatota archaeon]